MYRFYYDFIKCYIQSSECVKIMYIDTDSFILEVKKHNPYEVLIKNHLTEFDTSNYATDNRWVIPRVNKKIPGLVKDGNAGELMTHFIGLGSKCYSFKVIGLPDVRKIKGVKRHIVKNRITYDAMYNCLFETIEVSREQTTIKVETTS